MTETELLLRLSVILTEPNIRLHIDEIEKIRLELNKTLSYEDIIKVSSRIKDKIQTEAKYALSLNNYWGAFVGATGCGKSKVAIDIIADLPWAPGYAPKVLLVVPTEKLRDENWREEFEKWDFGSIYDIISRECYASLHKFEGTAWDLVILDEYHNITEANSEFFSRNKVERCICLSATQPTDTTKVNILKKLKLFPKYIVTLDDAVKLGLVAPYQITVVTMPLDDKIRNIQAGSKTNKFMQTEAANYKYLASRISDGQDEGNEVSDWRRRRMRFIYNLPSKTVVANLLLKHVIPEDKRTLIFCGSKDQANKVCQYRFYSKPTKPKAKTIRAGTGEWDKELTKYAEQMADWQGDFSLNIFRTGIIPRLSCVEALNEGHNLSDDLDCTLVVQINSQSLDIVQRIGRIVRFRPGYVARVIILCVKGTVDEEWAKEAIIQFDQSKITWVTLEELRLGNFKIF